MTDGHTVLPDGRRLAWSAAGPADGLPVLYFHGAIGTPLELDARAWAMLERLDVRWIGVQRPGFAGSDRAPGRSMLDFADDVGHLAGELGLHRPALVGVSAGGPYALACGALLGERVSAVAVCSSLSWLYAPHAAPGLAPHMRGVLKLLAGAPGACSAVADAALGAARRHRALIERTGAALGRRTPGGTERELCRSVARGVLAATADGVGGLLDDYLVCCEPWGFAPADVPAPVHVWHGVHDHLVPVEHAWRLAAELPGGLPVIEPDEGHFFFRRRATAIVERLVRTARRTSATEPIAA